MIPEEVSVWYLLIYEGESLREMLIDRLEDEEDVDGAISQIYYEKVLL